jgi:general secretion pathway protein D
MIFAAHFFMSPPRLRRLLPPFPSWILAVALSTGVARAQPVPEPKPAAGPADSVGPITLRDESIDQVLALLERWTGKTILRPQALPAATITLTMKGSVTREEAIRALETVLTMNGIAISPLDDKFLKVTALASAKSEAPELINGSTLALPPSGRIVSKVFQLDFLRVSEFMPLIAPLLNPGAGSPPVVFEKANAALVTDSLTNLQRIETLVARLDQPLLAGMQSKFYPLHFAKASDVVAKMHAILSGPLQNQIGTATTFNADDRTNQIILVADLRQQVFFDELIAKLDTKSDPNTRNEVIQLKHATASDVADVLSKLVSGQNAASKTAGQENLARSSQTPASVSQPPGSPAAPTPAPAPVAAAAAAVGLASVEAGGNQFSPLLTILADNRSNSLVVSGTVDDLRLIRELISKIDILLAQVRIEVIIAEVTLSDTDSSGITALNLTVATSPTTGKTGITNFDTGTIANGIAGWNITGGVVNPLAFNAAMGNTGQKHNVKILSAPTIVTTHNKQAQFAVTQQQPIITGSQSSLVTAGSAPVTSSTVSYKDIGITLKVTPLIGDDGSVQLTIDQIVDDVISNVTIDGNVQPVIGHREANSFVNVNDGQMIVLGGLQRSSRSNDRTKLGFLFEIPILSQLLGGRGHDTERTELLLFIRPHVLKPEEGTADTNRKIDELSSKKDIKQFLVDPDPTKQPKESLLEKVK